MSNTISNTTNPINTPSSSNTENKKSEKSEKYELLSLLFSRTYALIHIFLEIFSIYLSFRCNGGIKWGSLFISIVFPHIYIAYSLATYNGLCVNPNSTK